MSTNPLVYKGGYAAQALQHLAENGPTADKELREAMVVGSIARDPLSAAIRILRHLESLGLVRKKFWLTPAGLAEMKRLEMMPPRAGVSHAPAAHATTDEVIIE